MGALIDVSAAFAEAQAAAASERASSVASAKTRTSPHIAGWATGADVILPSQPGAIREPFRQHGIVWRCVSAKGKGLARFPLEIYPRGERDIPIDDHWLVRVWRRPDAYRRGSQLCSAISMWLDLVGESFLIHRDIRRGSMDATRRPMQLELGDPRAMVEIEVAGELTAWRYSAPGKASETLSLEQVSFFRLENPYHAYRGLGPVQAAWIEYSGDYRAALWNRQFLENSAIPPIVFQAHDPMATWPETERNDFVGKWESRHVGPGRVGKAAALPPGVEAKLLKVTQQEMDFIGGRTFSREQIASILEVPPAVVGLPASGAGNYQNYGQQRAEFHFGTLLPRSEYIQEVLTVDMLERYGEEAEAYFASERFTAEVQAEEHARKVEMGLKLWGVGVPFSEVNEKLSLGFETDDYPWLGEGFLPFSVVPAKQVLDPDFASVYVQPNPTTQEPTDGETDEETDPNVDPGEDPEAVDEPAKASPRRRLIRAPKGEQARAALWRSYARQMQAGERKLLGDWRRFLVRYRDVVLAKINASKGIGVHRAADDFLPPEAELHRLAVEATQATQRLIVKSSWEKLLAEIDVKADFSFGDPNVQRVLAERAQAIKGAADTVSDKVRDAIGDVIQEGGSPQDMAAAVRELIKEQYRGQAMTVARTESGAGFSRARREAMSAHGVLKHEWLSARDGKVRESHVAADGEVRVIGEAFPNGLTEPHMKGALPEEVVNCRCTSVPVLEA